ncbi:tetratricopeptide repeat protein [Shewanella sp. D64]|uniref:tetratricopeptide repeat protein n=1 Tax=unclassified Shewanella TaxID=196818 RepID=UPI0022BA18C0|nr:MULTISPECIES: tetratricopeptide repeat protein [unclassified Shewanella]MEC4725793.1 tetratricopeptide repeat protein [Shewanella sp. D64]MEC4737600.1 tetratricopeptide repeat protein [Shewanella sp. E94]WBJ93417.1 tetratricopeptide repeat protein [Shewanella sp. MTB7]
MFSVHAEDSSVEQCHMSMKRESAQISKTVCEEKLEQVDRIINPLITAKLMLALYDINLDLGDSQAAENYLDTVKQSDEFNKNDEIQYLWLRKKATQHLYKKEYLLAKELFEQAFVIAQTQASDLWLGKSYNDLALTEQYLNNYQKSLDYYKKSLVLKEKIGNSFYIANTLNNLGLIYKELEKFQEAQKYFELSLEQYLKYTSKNKNIHILTSMSHLYSELADIYNINGEFHKRYFYTNKIISAYSDTLNKIDLITALIPLAYIHINANEFEPASEVIKTLSEHLDSDEHSFHGDIYLLKSKLAKHEVDDLKAIEYTEEAIKRNDSNQDALQKMKIYHYASELYYDNGHPYEAIVYLKKYQALHETLLEAKYSENINIIQKEIENERIQRALVEEQVINQSKTQKIDKLVNLSLIITSISLLIGFIISLYIVKKRKAQQHLLTVIESHKQQLFLLINDESEQTVSPSSQPLSELLVSTMIDCIALWEKATQTNKVELADRSKIWKISVDSGRLRTRSLDKYLSLKKLPDNPRWRNVVKTCHFILSECDLSNDDRDLLTSHLNQIMLQVKSESMEA